MALVGDVVARFRAETSDYLSKIDAARAKNKELAMQLLETAGSAEKAMATLQVAKGKGALGDLGIDPRQMAGIRSALKEIDHAGQEMGGGQENVGKQAAGLRDLKESIQSFGSGDLLGGIQKVSKGLRDLQEGGGAAGLGSGVKAAFAVGAIEIAGKALAEATAKAVELKRQFDDGAISAGDMAEKLLSSLPILGNIWTTGRNIRELLGLQNNELEKQIALQEQLNQKRLELIDIVERAAKAHEQRAGETIDIGNEAHAKALENSGMANSAREFRINSQGDSQIAAATREIEKQRDADIAALEKLLTEPEKGSTVNALQKFHEAQTQKTTLEQQLAEMKAALPNAGQGSIGLIKSIQETEEKLATASEAAAKLNSFINRIHTKQTAIKQQADDDLNDRKAKINENVEQDLQRALGGFATGADADAAKAAEDLAKQIHDKVSGFFKDNPISEWVKGQLDDAAAKMKQFEAEADRIREQIKSPNDRFMDQVNAVMNNPALTGDEKQQWAGTTKDDLLKQRKDILDTEHNVYDLPKISELRSGQTLYAPPTKIDEQQLKKLEEISNQLGILNETASKSGNGGITIEELSI